MLHMDPKDNGQSWAISLTAQGLPSFCQHGHTGTESPSVLASEHQRLHVIRENFFLRKKEEASLCICVWQPQDAPKGLWRSRPESQTICMTGLSGCDLQPSMQHISWQLYTRHIISLLLTLGTVYQSHLQTGGLEGLTPLLGRPEMGGTVFSHWNSGSCCSKIAWGWQLPGILSKPSFASVGELGERVGCESCSG